MSSALDVVIGIDAGTTSAKAVVVDAAGHQISAGVSDEITTDTSAPGGSEQSPEEIWRAVATGVGRAVEGAPAPVEVVALAMAAQSGSVVPIGPRGTPTSRAITWMDTRSQPLVDSWPASMATRIRAISGWSPAAGLGLATISWLLDPAGGRSGATRWASVDDFLVKRLAGRSLTNPSNAAGMQLMDTTTLEWSDELCSWCGIDAAQLSPIVPSGIDVGPLDENAATATGVSPRARLLVGGHDQACAALGLGAVEPGAIVLAAGTAWVLTVVTGRMDVDDVPRSFNLSPHVVPSRWTASRFLGGLGAVIAWCHESVGPPGRFDRALIGGHPRRDQPFFLPAVHDAARTAWGHFTGPAEPDDPVDRLRTVYESCAFEVRAAVEEGPSPVRAGDHPIIFVGGGSRSAALTQTIADVLGRDLALHPDTSWPALGAARLAAIPIGWATPLPVAGAPTVVTHRPDRTAAYDPRYRIYQDSKTGAPR